MNDYEKFISELKEIKNKINEFYNDVYIIDIPNYSNKNFDAVDCLENKNGLIKGKKENK